MIDDCLWTVVILEETSLEMEGEEREGGEEEKKGKEGEEKGRGSKGERGKSKDIEARELTIHQPSYQP